MTKKTQKREATSLQKTSKKSVNNKFGKFTFQVNNARKPKKIRQLEESDDNFMRELSNLSDCGYISIGILPLLEYHLESINSLSIKHWYHNSVSLNYLYDNLSVKGYPTFKKESHSLSHYCDLLYTDFLEYLRDVRGMSKIYHSKCYEVCSWFIRHLHRCVKKRKLSITYARDKSSYQDLGASGIKFPYNTLKNLVDFLEYSGKVKSLTGYAHKEDKDSIKAMSLLLFIGDMSRYTTIKEIDYGEHVRKPSRFIEIRDPETKEPLPLDNFNQEEITRLECITEKSASIMGRDEASINGLVLPELWFKQIFIGSLNKAGRFYDGGQYQQFSKEERKSTVIGGCETVSWDLHSLHPRLLHLREGISLPDNFDPYPNLGIKVDTKVVNKFKDKYNLVKYNPSRNLAKVALLCMINAKSEKAAKDAINYKLYKDRAKIGNRVRECKVKFAGLPKNIDVQAIIDKIKEHNKHIAHWFNKGVGLELQNIDGKIMSFVINGMNEISSYVIPMHDGVVCSVKDKEYVYNLMREGYKYATGSYMNCVIEEE